MPQILVDRFVQSGTDWLDLATGGRVRIRFAAAAAARAQLAWSDWCASVARLRHPLINPLIDYGTAGAARTFEAYAFQGAAPAPAGRGAILLEHAAAFLHAQQAYLPRPVADYLLRPVVPHRAGVPGHAAPDRAGEAGPPARGPIAGIRLQPRPVLESITDVLHASGPPGICTVHISGEPRSGLRTLRLAAARAARIAGFIPLAAAAVPGPRWLQAALSGRHVCILADDADDPAGSALAAMVLALGAASARRHVVLRFGRRAPHGPALRLERMGLDALEGMLFLDHAASPSRDEVLRAARQAAGRPGHMLAHIAMEGFGGAPPSAPMMVHETSPAYGATRASQGALPIEAPLPSAPAPRASGALENILTGAPARALALAAAGRHASALRLLERAARVLAARGLRDDAARCAVARGHLLLGRARLADAIAAFEAGRELGAGSRTGVQAAVGIGIAWTDEGRLVEAEAALRAARVAAARFPEPRVLEEATTALARCLVWQGRSDEAGALLRRTMNRPGSLRPAARTLAMLARVLLAEQSGAAALRTARQAVEAAQAAAAQATAASPSRLEPRGAAEAVTAPTPSGATPAPPVALTGADAPWLDDLPPALRVLAQAAAAAGDPVSALAHVRAGLRAARAGHRPLDAARLRLAALDIQGTPGAAPASTAGRHAARLTAAARGWPPLLRGHARAVLARAAGAALDPGTKAFIDASGAKALAQAPCAGGLNPVADLEAFLSAGQTASDDRAAVERVADYLRARLRAATVLVIGPDPERRVLVQCGDAWRGEPVAAWRALASGFSVPLDPDAEPCQAAEPLRFGGDVAGALAARWLAGDITDQPRAAALLRVAALAMAANVRGLLDRIVAPPAAHPAGEIIGDSSPVRAMRDAIVRAARAPFPVLIEGESGSGKELVARAVHRLGPRRDRRFCAINCAALADDLLEAELFGHARGAFTGAVAERPGLFEEADGGTLFLDEIGELSARAQAKLLRVLQDGQVRRVGENHSRKVDVRIVAATNRRLADEAAAGRFRSDLRFRLDVVRIEVPPLRDRATDVPILAASFWTDAAARMGTRATLAPEALTALARYDWPGNVRELQNVIAWMAVHSPARGRITAAAVPAHVAQAAVRAGGTLETARLEFERRFVKAALASAGGRRSGAAAALGISRQGLAKMLRRLDLENEAR